MKIICIGTFAPRQCGIATFTFNLVNAMYHAGKLQSRDVEIEVIAMNENNQTYDYPAIVTRTIKENNKSDYAAAAAYINQSGADVCVIEHEYGIFGGNSGLLLLSLTRDLNIPIVTTLHSVLQNPNFHQKEVLKKLTLYSSAVIVMSRLAIDFLKEIYEVPANKIYCIEHGVPDFEILKPSLPSAPVSWKNRKVMLTFGLIGRSKGIEAVIRALPSITEKHPDFLYVIIGKTHPHVIRESGEEYRNWLQQMIVKLNLTGHVLFMDEYMEEAQLVSCLLAADLYVTPYLNKAQITSGTLCYALAGGCAVLSTPYWHAEEILTEGRGGLFGFGDHESLAFQINDLLDHPEKLHQMQQKAYDYGRSISWPLAGKKYLTVFDTTIDHHNEHQLSIHSPYHIIDFPFNPLHILRLTDDTGILQHAQGCTPNYKTGYCLDDNARALLLSMMAFRQMKDPKYINLCVRYLAYINFMQHKDGSFDNFMTFSHTLFENDFSEDAYGRTVWALGYMVRYAPNDDLFQLGLEIFHKSLNHLPKLTHMRGYANCILGLYHYVLRFPDQERYKKMISDLANILCDGYDQCNKESWHWYETIITYDNGLLPAAMYKAYEITSDERFLHVADKTTAFLESKCFSNQYLSLIGNRKWLRMDEDYELFAQQPIDAMAMVVLYDSIYQLKKTKAASDKLVTSFKWFLGYNDLDLPLYDSDTCGCNDGIEEYSINRNQGAESTIAYHIAWLIAAPFLGNEVPAAKMALSVEDLAYSS